MENFGNKNELLNPVELQELQMKLQMFIQTVGQMGANDVEIEAIKLQQRILSGAQISRQDRDKFLGMLGDPDDKNTNYH
jgi:hypothetical protein